MLVKYETTDDPVWSLCYEKKKKNKNSDNGFNKWSTTNLKSSVTIVNSAWLVAVGAKFVK